MARVDFHVHTPASADFLGNGTVEDVLRAAGARGLDIVVITDHNSLDGYLDVVDDLDNFAPLSVLAGVEVTARGGSSGIHVLAVFDPDKLGKRPRWMLNRLGLDADNRASTGWRGLRYTPAITRTLTDIGHQLHRPTTQEDPAAHTGDAVTTAA